MILASLGFSIMGALAKASMERIPPFETVFFRAAVCLPFLAFWMRRTKTPLVSKNNKMILLRSAAGFTALCLNFYATRHLSLADVTILIHTSPLFVALLSILFLGEKLNWELLCYVVLAFLGTFFIVKPQSLEFSLWSVAAMVSGLFAAIAYVSVKKLHKSDSSMTIVFNFLLFSSIVSLAIGGSSFVIPTLREFLILSALGTIGTLAQILMTRSYKLADATVVSPYFFSAILFASVWGFLFWGESPDGWALIGGGLIVICGIRILRLEKKKKDYELLES